MSSRLITLFSTVALLVAGNSVFGQARVFMVPAGEDPASYPSGQTTVKVDQIDVQAGGFALTLDIYLEDTTPTAIRGYQIVLDDATGGTSGVVDYNPDSTPPAIDEFRSDYIFSGAGSQTATAVDAGAPARLAAGVADATADAVAVSSPVYLGEITYQFSSNAAGTFHIGVIDPGVDQGHSQTLIADESSTPVAFGADGVVINITGTNIPTVSEWGLIVLALLILTAGTLGCSQRQLSLKLPCMLICLLLAGMLVGVVHAGAREAGGNCPDYGDATANGVIDLFDLFCVLDGTEGEFGTCSLAEVDLAPCGGDGTVDAADVAAVENAFASDFACTVNCLESGFEPGTWSPPPAALGERPGAGDSTPMANVYGFNGELYTQVVDLRIKGRGIDFVWARKYRSRLGPDTAQGNGWDFSYNSFIQENGDELGVSDGNSRRDKYELQPDGTWTRDEFFREIEQHPDGSCTLTFANNGSWVFHPLDGAPDQGKIASIVDRNGNAIMFGYDGAGRLTTVTDTLGRNTLVAYNPDGLIESVTDFIGRSVDYEYYDGIQPGGNIGDLKSVTGPAVVGTPNGNDFPLAKTTVYTYSAGFADARLNHNLLTITDPKGQTFLSNTYASTTNPGELDFDRVAHQTWGDPGDNLDVVYLTQVPSEANGFAVSKAIVNDRVGNVSEHSYDALNRAVLHRVYAGRAPNPNGPTTENANRPTNPLRPGDPSFFETRREYNEDALVTRVDYPNGNSTNNVYELELNPEAPRRSRGNLRELHQLPGPLGGDQAEIVQLFQYDPAVNFGHNYVTRHTDGRGNETLHEYDAKGNRAHTQHRIPSIVEDWEWNSFGQVTAHIHPDNGSGNRRRDEFTYYLQGPQQGYLERSIVDAPNFALTTVYLPDSVGNPTSITDPRGYNTLIAYNALDQVVRTTSREVVAGSGVRHERDFFYDANDNVVRVDVQNKNELGALNVNTHLTTIHEYEILNYKKATCTEDGNYTAAIPGPVELPTCEGLPDGEFITNEYEYDPNRNLTQVAYSEAVEGRQPTNTTDFEYDERDLIFKTVRAKTDPDQSSSQYDYDANGNLDTVRVGLEGVPHVTSHAYDGYNRLVASTDPMGNLVSRHFDANSNPVTTRADAELIDVPGSLTNVRLSETTYVYDALDRLIRTEDEFFDTNTQAPLQGGQVLGKAITGIEYSDNSQVVRVLNDNLHATSRAYDTANRRSTVTDHLTNIRTYLYDNNSNVTSATSVEKSDLGNPDQSFTTTYAYDNLDRLIQWIDNVGNTNTVGYDSRDNRTVAVDSLNRETRYLHDGINRLTSAIRDLDDDGADGDGTDITTSRAWDDTSRLTRRTDDNGNTTTYAYDALNRNTDNTYADGSMHQWEYDLHDNRVGATDANGTLVANTYDQLDRLTGRAIAPSPGVSQDTSFETWIYDGLSRIVSAEDDDSLVTRAYDSLSRVTSETLNGQTTISTHDGVGNKLSCNYPGGRMITRAFDELERVKTISDTTGAPTTIATYRYVGPASSDRANGLYDTYAGGFFRVGRLERREYGNGTRTDYAYDGITGVPNPPGDFGVKQVIGTTHSIIAGGATIDNRAYTWDKMYDKTQRKDVRAGGPQLTHDYTYDSIYRLTHTTVDDGAPTPVRDTDYTLDGASNRVAVTGNPDPGPHVGVYTMNPAIPEPADHQVNQYTTIGSESRSYDFNGNLIATDSPPPGGPPMRIIAYDYRNRMVDVTDLLGLIGLQRHTYAYDAFGRRIAKVVNADGPGPDETRYLYDGSRVIEEQNALSTTQATYVYGRSLDDVLFDTGGIVFDAGDGIVFDAGDGIVFDAGDGIVFDAGDGIVFDAGDGIVFDAGDGIVFDAGDGIVFDAGDGIVSMQRGGVDYYYVEDDLGNIMAMTDANGAAVERYEYADFGAVQFFNGAGQSIPASTIGNPYVFTGRRFDAETSLYNFRTRYLDPNMGRFTTRDTIGIWGDPSGLGNGSTYVGNNPLTHTDPYGLGPTNPKPLKEGAAPKCVRCTDAQNDANYESWKETIENGPNAKAAAHAREAAKKAASDAGKKASKKKQTGVWDENCPCAGDPMCVC